MTSADQASRSGQKIRRHSSKNDLQLSGDVTSDSTCGANDKEKLQSLSEDDDGSDNEDHTVYTKTEPGKWRKITGTARGHHMEPVPYIREHKNFSPKITDDKLGAMKDQHDNIFISRFSCYQKSIFAIYNFVYINV